MEKFLPKNINFISPKFGLNFLPVNEKINKELMLICGFENFKNLYIRIDILDRLFVKLVESNKTENKEIKLTPDMLNLLGCNKENFLKPELLKIKKKINIIIKNIIIVKIS